MAAVGTSPRHIGAISGIGVIPSEARDLWLGLAKDPSLRSG